MRKLLILLFMFLCSDARAQVTEIANVDSVAFVLEGLETVRFALPDPETNAAKRIYAEEFFKYRMVDTLGVQFPIILNKPDSVISAKIDSIILKHGKPDSTDDRGKLIGTRIDNFLALSVAERKAIVKSQKFLGLIFYASRNELIAITEIYDYQINSATKIQAIKKLVIGRLAASDGTLKTAFSIPEHTISDASHTDGTVTVTMNVNTGLAVSDLVMIKDVVGMTDLNDKFTVVSVPDTTHFTISLMTVQTYISGGKVQSVTAFDNKVSALRGLYFESEIK